MESDDIVPGGDDKSGDPGQRGDHDGANILMQHHARASSRSHHLGTKAWACDSTTPVPPAREHAVQHSVLYTLIRQQVGQIRAPFGLAQVRSPVGNAQALSLAGHPTPHMGLALVTAKQQNPEVISDSGATQPTFGVRARAHFLVPGTLVEAANSTILTAGGRVPLTHTGTAAACLTQNDGKKSQHFYRKADVHQSHD
jgi:hypothetical protein